MNNINFGRVLLGGLLAGLVLNVGEYLLNEIVLKNEMEASSAGTISTILQRTSSQSPWR